MKLPFVNPPYAELHGFLLQSPVVFTGEQILVRGHADHILQIGGQLLGWDGMDLFGHRPYGRTVFRTDQNKVVPLQREIARMEAVNLPFPLEFDADDILQGFSPLSFRFFR